MEPLHLQQIKESDGAIPRYLFRGFNEYSGGDANLNTESHIIPYAFLGPYDRYLCPDAAVVSSMAMGALYGTQSVSTANCTFCNCKMSCHKPVPLARMSRARLSFEVTSHLETEDDKFASHFSSWTADLWVAEFFAGRGPGSYIGILDTALRESQNVILHAPLLYEAGLTEKYNAYPFEYLVYGPVRGIGYTCMTLGDLWKPSAAYRSGKWLMDTLLGQRCGSMVRNAIRYPFWAQPSLLRRCRFVRYPECYRHGLNVPDEDWKPLEQDLSLFLTVIAANWSVWCAGTMTKLQLESKQPAAIEEAVSRLSSVIWKAAKDPNVVLPIVNLNTYVEHLPRVDLMIKLLQRVEVEIVAERNRSPRYSLTW